jgi:hypothetical protein
VAVVASLVPALRASRISTVDALADAARRPRRARWLTPLSARLPVPLLLGVRVAARRPRRVLLGVVSIAVTVSGIVVVLAGHAAMAADWEGASRLDPEADRANQVLLVISVILVALAAINAVFITWATVLDARHSSALARALGATPSQVSAGLSAAQILREPRHPGRARALQHPEQRRGANPAVVAAGRGGGADRPARGGAHDDPGALRRPPPGVTGPPGRDGLTETTDLGGNRPSAALTVREVGSPAAGHAARGAQRLRAGRPGGIA